MGVVVRKDSPYYWLNLERPGLPPVRQSTRIPVKAPTPALAREQRRLAEAAYAAQMGDLARQRFDLPSTTPAPAFRVWAAWYLQTVTPTKRSAAREASAIKTLVAGLGRYPLHHLTPDLVHTWRRTRLTQVKWNTVNRELDVLKAILTAAVPKHLTANPLAGMPRVRPSKAEHIEEMRVLSRDEELRLLAVATDLEDRALIVCALDTLTRLGDLVLLRWKHDQGGYLRIVNPKVTPYLAPVSTRLRKLLDQLPRTDRYIFPSYRQKVKAAQDRFLALCTAARLPVGRAAGGLTFHCLRHTGATRLVEAGWDLRTVQAIGGWRDLRSVMRYAHPTGAERAAVNTIGARPVHARAAARASARGKQR